MNTGKIDKRTGKKQVTIRKTSQKALEAQLSIEEAIDKVVIMKKAKNLKERTVKDYVTNMNYFSDWVRERFEDISIHEITSSILRDYILWCSTEKDYFGGHPFRAGNAGDKKGIASSSVNVRIRVIKTFFNELYNDEVLSNNPAANLSLMRQEIDTVEPLTDDELKRFMKAPDQRQFAQYRDYIIMALIVDTGIRINEICSLEKTEVDFLRKRITLPAIKNKNRKSRVLPISPQITKLLQKLINETEEHFESDYVFTTNSGNELSEKTVQKSFTKYAKKARLQRNVSPHVLRHNFATMAAHNGMSVFHLMKILGHSDIKTTRKYVQVNDADLFAQHNMYSPLTRIIKRV